LIVVAPTTPDFQKGDTVRGYSRLNDSAEKPTQPGVITDKFGVLQPCILELPNDQLTSGARLQVRYELERPAGTVIGHSRTAEAEIIGEAMLDFKAPAIKEAPDNILSPFAAKDMLTAIIPANPLLIGAQLSVTWSGTAGGGSHTTTPINLSTAGPHEVSIPNTVVPNNLGKSVVVSYLVAIKGKPYNSLPSTLTVQAIANEDPAMGRPFIIQAANGGEGPELDISQQPSEVTMRVNSYPYIALEQYVWLRLEGINTDNTLYTQTFWQPPAGKTNSTWISQGYYTQAVPLAVLKNLKNGSNLIVEFKAGLTGSQVEAETVTFPRKIYTIKTLDAVSGFENWQTEPVQKFLINTPAHFKSGLSFTLLEGREFSFIENRSGNHILFLKRHSRGKFGLPGSARKIEFLFHNAHSINNIYFFDASEQLFDARKLPLIGNNFERFGFDAPAGRYVAYFEIDTTGEAGGGLYFDDIRWS
jgi:hypothetical protein